MLGYPLKRALGILALKKLGLKKLPNKITILTARLALEKSSLETLVALAFYLRNQ